ncbi:hypothetical protein A3C26_04030 [Candidatus Daviesbacteria bacterium RIFCSPHIGHO2_02_FULL_39_12]|uniref:DUF3105 domain-containing protein n=1 Tax=Candidatus Daviesbacteria bacterium RIFCSPHIGHO2_02_FULL_39_12 TaxID=1797770 RepID=A0A1F5J9H3_9BACT|nr:MAG: hypothetical protein A3C26_04030 [Candidatus Daviesbacteria bacterium RIFCSPHIGHO2_02_FULL_39_12]
MTTGTKIISGVVAATIVIFAGAIWLLSNQSAKEDTKLSKPLTGEIIADQGANHIPESSQAAYITNPPTGGPHYAKSASAGIYEKEVPDGNLIHSMEHGAVILWYSGLSVQDIEKLKQIFSSVNVSKKIMVPKNNLDVPLALTSWGRLLKLQTIDGGQIKTFMETNEDRGPEKAPL